MIDLQFDSDIPHSMTQEVTTQPKYIAVKVIIIIIGKKKCSTAIKNMFTN